MSTALFLLVPLGVLAVAWSACFVGCVLDTFGQGQTGPYSSAIINEPDLLAYWPLNDLLNPLDITGATINAHDLSGKSRDGTFIIPPAYPSGMQAVPQSRVLNPPTLARGASIIPGDAGSPVNALAASAIFAGGIVSIPWSTQSWPLLSEFTVEAWVKPNWTGAGFIWVLFSAASDTAGFTLFIDDTNQWGVTIGNGTALTALPPTNVSIDPASANPTYVALTFSNGVFRLWINPLSDTSMPAPANWTSDQTNYTAADPSQLLQAFIGAGANNQPLRTATNPSGAPLFPFQGLIQSVAVYQKALDPADLQAHFIIGAG